MQSLTIAQMLAITVAAQEPPMEYSTPVFAEVKKMGMVEERYAGERFIGWKLTERGEEWVAYILQVPLPERRYIVPYFGNMPEVDRRNNA